MVQTSDNGFHAAHLQALRTIEHARDKELSAHESNVGKVCELLCSAFGLDAHFTVSLKIAAQLHDLGKLAISDEILRKPGPLDAEQAAIIRRHSQLGHDVLIGAGDPVLDFAATVALNHHEKFDGSGYPRGLRGEAIPLGSRIVAICDVYDALRADRAYRPGLTHTATLAVLTAPTGRASRDNFDPRVLDALIRCADQVEQIYATRAADTRFVSHAPSLLGHSRVA